MAKSIYISYFGISQPLVQSQVLPYLRELLKVDGVDQRRVRPAISKIHLLTFEPRAVERKEEEYEELRRSLAAENIEWHWLPYHKRFSIISTAWDIACGAYLVRRLIRSEKPEILHGRVHVPTLMAAIARRFSRHKPKLLFDIRGFFPEEYTDAGIWKANGMLYKVAKYVEKSLLKSSDGFVVLTEKARSILFPESKEAGFDQIGRPVEVIPCCVDFGRFHQPHSPERNTVVRGLEGSGRTVAAYVGSFGGWYLTDETIKFLATAKALDESLFALILTQSEKDPIRAMLRASGFKDGDFLVTQVDPADVPKYLSVADFAVSFIKPCFSKQASSPTKNAEYLAMGLPIIANIGIGDTDRLIQDEEVGALLSEFSEEGYQEVFEAIMELRRMTPDLSTRCRSAALRHFDLESVAGFRYNRLYRRLLSS